MKTIRQQIINLLENKAMSSLELSKDLGVKQREIEEHLKHIQLTIKTQNKQFILYPSYCLDCNFEFKERNKSNKPGKCPKCRGTYISPPGFKIKE